MEPLSSELFSPWEPGILSLIVYGIMVLAAVCLLLFISRWLGEREPGIEKMTPYECGILSAGVPSTHLPIPFYLVALYFLIFDVEAAFIFSWAVAFESLGFDGWLRMTFFIFVLLISLFYVWKKGGLEWRPGPMEHPGIRKIRS